MGRFDLLTCSTPMSERPSGLSGAARSQHSTRARPPRPTSSPRASCERSHSPKRKEWRFCRSSHLRLHLGVVPGQGANDERAEADVENGRKGRPGRLHAGAQGRLRVRHQGGLRRRQDVPAAVTVAAEGLVEDKPIAEPTSTRPPLPGCARRLARLEAVPTTSAEVVPRAEARYWSPWCPPQGRVAHAPRACPGAKPGAVCQRFLGDCCQPPGAASGVLRGTSPRTRTKPVHA